MTVITLINHSAMFTHIFQFNKIAGILFIRKEGDLEIIPLYQIELKSVKNNHCKSFNNLKIITIKVSRMINKIKSKQPFSL